MSDQQFRILPIRRSTSSRLPRVTITSDEDNTEDLAIFVGQIPATQRLVYRLLCNKSDSYRFRPSPDPRRDPFAHAILNPPPVDEKCSILHCEYCALCQRYQIDPHAFQATLVPQSTTPSRWDPYFHWFLNEQITNIHFGNMGPGSRNWSDCWITHCPCRDLDLYPDQTKPAPPPSFLGCLCKRLRTKDSSHRYTCCEEEGTFPGNEEVAFPQPKGFPFLACPRYRAQRPIQGQHIKKCCRYCFIVEAIQQKGLAYMQIHYSQREAEHNDMLFRRIAYALNPLAVDPDAGSNHAPEDYDEFFFNLPEWALRSYRKTWFSTDAAPPRRGREGKPWTRTRCSSPHPRVSLEHVQELTLDGFESGSSPGHQSNNSSFSEKDKGRMTARSGLFAKYKNIPSHSMAFRQSGSTSPRNTSPPLLALTASYAHDCITRMDTHSAEKALQTLQHDKPSTNIANRTRGSTPSAAISPYHQKKPRYEAEQLSAEEECFRAWIDDVEGYTYREPPRVVRKHISFWRKVKIICGLEEDPNCCRHCELNKAACECHLQQGHGDWSAHC